jgi:hypothetical protein
MISKQVPMWLKEQTWEYLQENNMGQRHSANGTKSQQYTGLLGENMVRIMLGLKPSFIPGYDGGHDLLMNSVKVDVKTMGRHVDPKPEYVNNFIGYQKDLDAQMYIFCSMNKNTSIFFVCGLLTKIDLLDYAHFYPAGSIRYRDDDTSFRMKAPTYEIANSSLIQLQTPTDIWAETYYYEPGFLD